MVPNDVNARGCDHEIVILLHLVKMVKVARGVADEEMAQRLRVTSPELALLLSENSRPTVEQLRQLFLAVGMETEGVFQTSPGQPDLTTFIGEGFGNAIERGLEILNEEDAAAEPQSVGRERSEKHSRQRGGKGC